MHEDARPVYLRLRDHIAAGIIDGTYAEGTMLPSVRALAAEHEANPLTVAKACQMFQFDGLIEARRGVGMIVLPGAAQRLRERERMAFLAREWPQMRARMHLLGLSAADLLAKDGLA